MTAIQMPLLPYMPVYTPSSEEAQPEGNDSTGQPQHTDDLFVAAWANAEADDYEEALADEEFWRRGDW